jgi:hypothetical protein
VTIARGGTPGSRALLIRLDSAVEPTLALRPDANPQKGLCVLHLA